MEKELYKHLNIYLKEKFGERTLKICIDGGFTCPNRDGTISTGGCIFCSEKGSGDHIKPNLYKNIDDICKNIKLQIKNYFKSYKAQRANKFIAYFQNFTNTYDTIENLKRKYDSSLIDNRIVALAIATRPDCINEQICELLQSYKSKTNIWIELGLQTSNDEIGNLINRGYSSKDFTQAITLLNKYNIDVVVHIMIGLPHEKIEDIKNTVQFINNHNIQGLKIHSTYVIKNTILEKMLENNTYNPISLDYYLENLAYILTHINPEIIIHKISGDAPINPEIIIHKISGDAPKDLLIAPNWNKHKKWILNGLEKYLKENNLYQGIYYKKPV